MTVNAQTSVGGYQYTWRSLVKGSNGSGFSTMLNIEYMTSVDEKSLKQSILFNCGDSTQQACLQAKLKLQKLTTIIITSLSPHNTSGLPGIIFCLPSLGNLSVRIIGPVGLKGMVDVMSFNITKRNFPVIQVIEIGDSCYPSTSTGGDSSFLPIVTESDSLTIHTIPVWSTVPGSKAIGVACYLPDLRIGVLPIDLSLKLQPSSASLIASFSTYSSSNDNKSIQSLLFIPLTIYAQSLPLQTAVNFIETLLTSEDMPGISLPQRVMLHHGNLSNKIVEFPSTQQSLFITNKLYPSLFPRSFPDLYSACSKMNLFVCSATLPSSVGDKGHEMTTGAALSVTTTCACQSAAYFDDTVVGLHDSMIETLQFIHSKQRSEWQCCQCCELNTATPNEHANHLHKSHVFNCLLKWNALTNGRKVNTAITTSSADTSTSASVNSVASTNREASQMIKKLLGNRAQTAAASNEVTAVTAYNSSGHNSNNKLSHNDLPKGSSAMAAVYVPPPSPYDLEVSLLGTGSAAPSKRRSNSCIIIKLPLIPHPLTSAAAATTTTTSETVTNKDCVNESSGAVVVLDAGEGVCRQLFQSVSGDVHRYDQLLTGICIVWLSHHHGDHVTGLLHLLEQILLARTRTHNSENKSRIANNNNDKNEKILIFSPSTALSYLQYSVDISGLDDIVEFIPIAQSLYAGCTTRVREATRGVLNRLVSVSVPHCQESYAVCLEINIQSPAAMSYSYSNNFNNGRNVFKLVYSGDCRPSQGLSTAGRDCDLLIHEATFSDDCAALAQQKRHCTTSEALHVAREMRAKHVILTHFSQRYAIRSQTEVELPSSSSASAVHSLEDDYNDLVNDGVKSLSPRKRKVDTYSFIPEPTWDVHQSNAAAPSHLPAPKESQSHSFAVAFDFLRFRCPSQLNSLPGATRDIAEALELIYREQSTS